VELCSLLGHTAEIVSLNFNTDGKLLPTTYYLLLTTYYLLQHRRYMRMHMHMRMHLHMHMCMRMRMHMRMHMHMHMHMRMHMRMHMCTCHMSYIGNFVCIVSAEHVHGKRLAEMITPLLS
jgi:hypothetical protein